MAFPFPHQALSGDEANGSHAEHNHLPPSHSPPSTPHSFTRDSFLYHDSEVPPSLYYPPDVEPEDVFASTEPRRSNDSSETAIGEQSEDSAIKYPDTVYQSPVDQSSNQRRSSDHELLSSRRPSSTLEDLSDQRPAASGSNNNGGFFHNIFQTLRDFTQDENIVSCPPSRRSSFSGSITYPYEDSDSDSDPFRRSMDMDREFKGTGPEDEKRAPFTPERTQSTGTIDSFASVSSRPSLEEISKYYTADGRRKSYHERRKKESHNIVLCAQSVKEYQTFIVTLTKALLTFGSPSHRIEGQLLSLTKVFNIQAEFLHSAGTVQIAFGNSLAHTTENFLIKSAVSLSLSRIHNVHNIYRMVLHDEMLSSEGTNELKKLLEAPPRYGYALRCLLSFITSGLISGIAFGGSPNDIWVSGILGLCVRLGLNHASKSDLSASGSEVFTAAFVSFVARAFSIFPTQIWCYTAISSASVISLLPGFLILSGSLDVAGRNTGLGSPKIISGLLTSLYLGFGLTVGSDVFLWVDKPARRTLEYARSGVASVLTGAFVASNGTTPVNFSGVFTFEDGSGQGSDNPVNIIKGCFRDPEWHWTLQPVPTWSLFFLVPIFAFCASMSNGQHWYSRQMVVMVLIACISFGMTKIANLYWGLSLYPDYVSLLGSLFVGLLGNAYSRRFGGTAFTVMLTGILLLVPDGLSAAGGLAQNYTDPGQDEYTQSLSLARKMISVIIGIMAGVYASAAVIYIFGKKKNAALVTF